MSAAWFLFDAGADAGTGAACPAGPAAPFADRVANARLATGVPTSPGAPPTPDAAPPSVNDGDLSPLASLLQWLDPTIHDQLALVAAVPQIAGLPLVEVRAPQEAPGTFAVMLSGDGGWAAIDRGVSAQLAAKGISTVGWDSLSYFWKARTPAASTRTTRGWRT